MSAHDDFEWGTPADLLDEIDRLRSRLDLTKAEMGSVIVALSFCLAGEEIFTNEDGFSDESMWSSASSALDKITDLYGSEDG